MSQQDSIIWVFASKEPKAAPILKGKPIMGTVPPRTKLTTVLKGI